MLKQTVAHTHVPQVEPRGQRNGMRGGAGVLDLATGETFRLEEKRTSEERSSR